MASASSSETDPLLECSHHRHHLPKGLVHSLSLTLSPAPASPWSNLTVAPMSSSTVYHLAHSLRHVDRSPGILPATSSQRGSYWWMTTRLYPYRTNIIYHVICKHGNNNYLGGWILKASKLRITQMVCRCTITAIYPSAQDHIASTVYLHWLKEGLH